MGVSKERDPRSAEEVLTEFVVKVRDREEPVFMGIDPGSTGAIGLICGRISVVADIPTLKVERLRVKQLSAEQKLLTGRKTKSAKGTTTKFNLPAIVGLFRIVKPLRDRMYIALEQGQVQVRGKGANAYSGFRIGVGYGMWPLFLTVFGAPVEEFTPGQWKQKMGLTSDKGRSRLKALQLFPQANIARKQDHDRAEALLLCEYLRRKHAGK
jgi:hypothetical protein